MWTSLMNSICNQCFYSVDMVWTSLMNSICNQDVNGRKHWLHIEFIREVHVMSKEENNWLHIEFIREVHIMSTEENTGYISNWSERSTSCQRKKTLVTYRIHQRGPHHVNGRKHWLHIEFIREVHIMSTEENTGYISNSSERSTSCQRKKTLVT